MTKSTIYRFFKAFPCINTHLHSSPLQPTPPSFFLNILPMVMESEDKLLKQHDFITGTILSCPTLVYKHSNALLLELAKLVLLSFVVVCEFLLILNQCSPLYHALLPCSVLLFLLIKPLLLNSPQMYLVDFSCFKPPSFCRVPSSEFLENASLIGCFDKETIGFMAKALSISGQSEETYLPPSLHYIPPRSSQQTSIDEVHMVLFPVMEDLLVKTNLFPSDIDILILNCSGFCPSPSLSSIIVNRFSMREDIKSYNLSGMGCSAAMAGIDLAKNLLKVHQNSNAVILSTEILSTGWYPGNEPSMLGINCFFRMGSSAVFVTNKREANFFPKYKLVQTLRTQTASEDRSYLSAIREEDSKGFVGVLIRKGLLQVVQDILRTHIVILGSRILPLNEQVHYGISVLKRKYINKMSEIYVPNFRSVIQHFVLPTSTKPYLKEIGKRLRLNERDVEGALMTLHRFGNQSSSSLWYELAYIEAKERIKVGDKVWQLGTGSGTKCNSSIWECIRPIKGEANKGPWADCIHRYPVLDVADGKPF